MNSINPSPGNLKHEWKKWSPPEVSSAACMQKPMCSRAEWSEPVRRTHAPLFRVHDQEPKIICSNIYCSFTTSINATRICKFSILFTDASVLAMMKTATKKWEQHYIQHLPQLEFLTVLGPKEKSLFMPLWEHFFFLKRVSYVQLIRIIEWFWSRGEDLCYKK